MKYALYNKNTKQYSSSDEGEVKWTSDLNEAREWSDLLLNEFVVVDAEELIKGNIVEI